MYARTHAQTHALTHTITERGEDTRTSQRSCEGKVQNKHRRIEERQAVDELV